MTFQINARLALSAKTGRDNEFPLKKIVRATSQLLNIRCSFLQCYFHGKEKDFLKIKAVVLRSGIKRLLVLRDDQY